MDALWSIHGTVSDLVFPAICIVDEGDTNRFYSDFWTTVSVLSDSPRVLLQCIRTVQPELSQ